MLDKPYQWATAQMPVNVLDAHYRSFQKEVVPVCLARGIGVLGMKSLGGGAPRGRIPAQAGVSAQDCIRYALSQPVSALVAGIMSMDDLRQDVAIARNFTPMAEPEKTALVERVRLSRKLESKIKIRIKSKKRAASLNSTAVPVQTRSAAVELLKA